MKAVDTRQYLAVVGYAWDGSLVEERYFQLPRDLEKLRDLFETTTASRLTVRKYEGWSA